jgi:hypothetical protein
VGEQLREYFGQQTLQLPISKGGLANRSLTRAYDLAFPVNLRIPDSTSASRVRTNVNAVNLTTDIPVVYSQLNTLFVASL